MSKSLVTPHVFLDWIGEDEIEEILKISSLEEKHKNYLITRKARAGNFSIEKRNTNKNGKPTENLWSKKKNMMQSQIFW